MEPEQILDAVRSALGKSKRVHEVKMFGGVGFMLNGNMLVAVSKRGLLVRAGKHGETAALSRPGASRMEMAGRTMRGYIRVDANALTKARISTWVELARTFVETLPAKPTAAARRRKTR
jgi:TfoX/Sxy family transcriptional regulator of competence genes